MLFAEREISYFTDLEDKDNTRGYHVLLSESYNFDQSACN